MIECIFGWGKQHGTMRKIKHRVICRVAADFMLNLIAYNLIPVPNLVPAKLPPNNRPHHQSHAQKRKTNAVPREF